MSAHTPGPWVVDVEAGIPGIFANDGIVVCYTGEVAGIVRHYQRDNSEADARLIAAAPDLLAFVQEWLADFTAVGTTDSPREAAARALIAKATEAA